jgi:hypothetical protein
VNMPSDVPLEEHPNRSQVRLKGGLSEDVDNNDLPAMP